jgi:hypothetical protein
VFSALSTLWSEVIQAITPYLRHQRHAQHFDFYGLDVIADQNGNCHLIEVNRLPGLESSQNNKLEEDKMYNQMMIQALRLLLLPILPTNVLIDTSDWIAIKAGDAQVANGDGEKDQRVLNTLRWKCMCKKYQKQVLAIHN